MSNLPNIPNTPELNAPYPNRWNDAEVKQLATIIIPIAS